jgi:hypothetical protein
VTLRRCDPATWCTCATSGHVGATTTGIVRMRVRRSSSPNRRRRSRWTPPAAVSCRGGGRTRSRAKFLPTRQRSTWITWCRSLPRSGPAAGDGTGRHARGTRTICRIRGTSWRLAPRRIVPRATAGRTNGGPRSSLLGAITARVEDGQGAMVAGDHTGGAAGARRHGGDVSVDRGWERA